MAKTKKTGWDRPVTVANDGMHAWQTGVLQWKWFAQMGISLYVVIDGRKHSVCCAATLATAGMIAEGFACGWEAAQRAAAVAAVDESSE